MYTYTTGVYTHTSGSYLTGHVVLVIGWGLDGGTPYWLCQNSWGENWGDGGYVRIAITQDYAGCNFGEWAWWATMDVGATASG